jgi:amino acid adenylation domain-containing protein
MGDTSRINLPPEQETIWAKCFQPTGSFVDFNKGEIAQSISHRFDKITSRFPERIAVKTATQALTYAELNASSNRLARALPRREGNQEAVVLLLDKGASLMAAMLAVLKAGKFFVLLDPGFPATRLQAVLEDCQARLVITDRSNYALARSLVIGDSRIIEFEAIGCAGDPEDPRLPISPQRPAFITYTSGSTGKPKGVLQTHRNLLHNIMLRTHAMPICAEDRIALLPSGTSNAIMNAFFGLLNGAMLLPFDVRKEGLNRLGTWLAEERITFLWISSPLFRTFCESLTPEQTFPDLRLLRLMSETVYRSDINLYKRQFSANCLFVNALHSSETGPLAIYFMDRNTELAGEEVPVGYAMEDKEILLLGDDGNKVGFNEVGEIVVKSAYLSPGYWRQPGLTAAKFKPDPQDGEKQLYYTGDLGSMRPDGCLVHKGRKDFRVKIRGYGVETGEVEKILYQHEAVSEVVVVAREHGPGETRLVAYFASRCGQSLRGSELRAFLTDKIPEHMIPSSFVYLDRLPLTPNGKVDRRALPTPGNSRPDLDGVYVEPRTSLEELLAKIWAEVLVLDRIGVHDNFFDLGGHSLAATRVVSRVLKQFQVEVPLKSLFHSPTVGEMAAVITEHQAKKLSARDLDRIMAELESVSDEQAKLLSAQDNTEG